MKFYKYTLFVIILLFTGCNANRNEERLVNSDNNENYMISTTEHEYNDVSNNLRSQNDSLETEQDIYDIIINQYIDAMENDYYQDILEGKSTEWELIGSEINLNLLYSLLESSSYKVYYALEDINNDGTPELFIGGSEGDDTPKYFDMFIVDKSKLINPFSELGYEFGHRNNLYLFSNGILDVEWTNSGFNNGMEFYSISLDGSNVELVESLSIDYTTTGEAKYYHGTERNTEIEEEDWYSILDNYRVVGAAELKWIEISR